MIVTAKSFRNSQIPRDFCPKPEGQLKPQGVTERSRMPQGGNGGFRSACGGGEARGRHRHQTLARLQVHARLQAPPRPTGKPALASFDASARLKLGAPEIFLGWGSVVDRSS